MSRDNVIPRYHLTAEERLQLSPVLARHLAAVQTPPRHTIHLNHNYPSVTSRYNQPTVVSRGFSEALASGAAATPARRSESRERSATPRRTPTRRAVSPSLARFPGIKSRYLDDVRLTSSSALQATPSPGQHRAPSTQRDSPSRDAQAYRSATIRSPFRAGARSATPHDILERNKRLLAACPTISPVQSVVRSYIHSPRPTTVSPSRRQSPQRVSPRDMRHPSPKPLKRCLAEEKQYIEQWREDRSHTRVPTDHVPRVATLSPGWRITHPAPPPPEPVMRWTAETIVPLHQQQQPSYAMHAEPLGVRPTPTYDATHQAPYPPFQPLPLYNY